MTSEKVIERYKKYLDTQFNKKELIDFITRTTNGHRIISVKRMMVHLKMRLR